MRIFVFTEWYPSPYKTYYDSQFIDLLQKGHDVRVFASGRQDRTVNEKVEGHGLLSRTKYYPATLRSLPRFIPALARNALRRPSAAIEAARAAIGDTRGFKRQVSNIGRALSVQHGRPDFCLIHTLNAATQFSWLRNAFRDVPTALYYHGGEVPSVKELSVSAAADAFRAVDFVFTNTEFSRAHAITRGCPPEKTVVLPVGFALDDFVPPEPRHYRSEGKLRLLSAGRMSEEKGFMYALEAVKRVVESGRDQLVYSLTGEGYLRPALEAYVREYQLERHVRFLGTLTTYGVIRAMGEADALLLPSIHLGNWAENQACAVQEAMLMKASVITTTAGGVPESIPAEMQAFAVAPENSEALAESIARVYDLTPAELSALGAAGRQFVVDKYDIRQLNDRMLKHVYGDVSRTDSSLPVRRGNH